MDTERYDKIKKFFEDESFEWSMSDTKEHIWFKTSGGSESGTMEIINTKAMTCYAYKDNQPVDPLPTTRILLQTLKAELDKKQSRLF